VRRTTGKVHDLSDLQYRLLSEFRFRIRSFLHFSEETARNSGLEPQQHQLLLALRGLPEGSRPTIGTLADRLCLRHHTAVELVNRLAERGAVARRHNEDDRREVLVQITSKGEAVLRELSDSHWQELKKQGPALAAALDELLADMKGSQRIRNERIA
jgi:DNA-binding MarR family transcriptional regulator